MEGTSTPAKIYHPAMIFVLGKDRIEELTDEEYEILAWPADSVAGSPNVAERYWEICDSHEIDSEIFWKDKEDKAGELEIEGIRNGERELLPGAQETLEELGDDYALGLVTNNTQGVADFVVDYFGFDMETQYGLENSIEGFTKRKPSPHYILEALNDLEASNAVYVGDKETDVMAANRAGIDSVYIGENPPEEADTHIENITELTEVI